MRKRNVRRRVKLDVTIDREVLSLIDALRGREKRSTFVEHIMRLGLEVYREGEAEAENQRLAKSPVEAGK